MQFIPKGIAIAYTFNTNTFSGVDLNKELTIFPDTENTLTFKEILEIHRNNNFIPLDEFEKPLSHKHTYWTHFSLQNKTSASKLFILKAGKRWQTSEATLFITDKKGNLLHKKYQSYYKGGNENFPDYTKTLFKVNARKNSTYHVYLKVKNNNSFPPQFNVSLEEPNQYLTHANLVNVIHGMFIGICLVTCLFIVLIYIFKKTTLSIYLSLHIAFTALYIAGYFGFLRQLFFEDMPLLNLIITTIAINGAGIFYFKFLQSHVQTKHILPRWHFIINAFVWMMTGIMAIEIIALVVDYNHYFVIKAISISFIVLGILAIILLYNIYKKNTITGNIFILSSSILIPGMTVAAILSGFYQNENAMFYGELGILSEILILSAGRFYRNQQIEEEKDAIQDDLVSFLYKSSHTLKGPLSSIKGLVQMLKKDDFKDIWPSIIDHIMGTTDRMDKILEKLRYVDLLKNNETSISHSGQWIHSHAFIFELTENIKADFQADIVKTDLQCSVESFYFHEPELLKIILKNLIENAIQFRRPRNTVQPFIQINIDKKHNHLILHVKDNGKGISSEFQASIFKMFYKADPESPGSGLGLYLVKMAVEKLKGSLEMVSRVNGYTHIVVKLPVSDQINQVESPLNESTKIFEAPNKSFSI